MRHLQPVRALLRLPRREAEVGQRLLPALRGPVRAVRCLARGDDVRQRGAVVAAAAAPEALPVDRVVAAPAAGIVEVEAHLVRALSRRERVDRAPYEDVLHRAALVIREHRLALRLVRHAHDRRLGDGRV